MDVVLEVGEALARTITVTFPSQEVDQKSKETIQQETKGMSIKGFPPGKVPMRVLKGFFGSEIREKVRLEVMYDQFYKAAEKEGVKPASVPEFDVLSDKEGKEISFKASFEVFPTLDIQDASGIAVEKWTAEIKEEDIDQMIETLRGQFAESVEVEREAKKGDELTISFKGEIDGEAFDGGSADDVPLELGSDSMIPGFEAGLEGAKPGDTVTLNVTFPEDYHSEKLAGKPAVFTVEVKKVVEKQLPEVDQAFADRFKVESVAALREDVQVNMERELEFALNEKLKSALFDGLIEKLEFPIPAAAIEQEARHMQVQSLRQMGLRDVDLSKLPPMPIDPYKEEAEKRVRYGLLITHFIEALNIEPNEEQVDALIQKLSTVYEDGTEVIDMYKNDKEKRAEVEFMAKEDLLVAKLAESAEITNKEVKFFDVIQPKQMRNIV